MNKSLKVLKELVEFIEENNINDRTDDGGDGYVYTRRSDELEHLINQAKEVIKKELENEQLINKIRKSL
jgi:hypothetical protein